MTIPHRVCLKPGCKKAVKINPDLKTAITCDSRSCNAYMEVIKDNTTDGLKDIDATYYNIIKMYDSSKDIDALKSYTNNVRNEISHVYNNIVKNVADTTMKTLKRSREEFETSPSDINLRITQICHDMSDDKFNSITNQGSLAQFFEEALFPLPQLHELR